MKCEMFVRTINSASEYLYFNPGNEYLLISVDSHLKM